MSADTMLHIPPTAVLFLRMPPCCPAAKPNFTPFRIRVPEDIVVQNTSLYAHLAVMFNRLNFNEIK